MRAAKRISAWHDRHQMKLLSECPNCGARFKFPSFIPFA
ncbi:hypothetical protein GM3708_3344 [Geminocystis sp. NIES-3708]|nr:hypothetical protein GM3708_3344 [Geminocystis sp. NIES-3708]